jgi:hypothetical protein
MQKYPADLTESRYGAIIAIIGVKRKRRRSLTETPIALDAFVFLKHYANPVESLTIGQIRKIYTKQITEWLQSESAKAVLEECGFTTLDRH